MQSLRRELLTTPALVDTHYHLREDDEDNKKVVSSLIFDAARGGAAVIGVMPNVMGGLDTVKKALAYRKYCEDARPDNVDMGFIWFCQITKSTTREDIDAFIAAGFTDAKVYPLNRTTNSASGVRDYYHIIAKVVYACSRGMRVHFHPEHPWLLVENRDAEFQFVPIIDMVMQATEGMPGAIIWEHGTDARCIPFWKEWAETGRFYVTLTAHHLATSENNVFGDVQATCKPPIKTLQDQLGLVSLVSENHSWVMAGTDSAAHPVGKKHVLGPCACGAFTAPFAMALYAHALYSLLGTEKSRRTFTRFTSANACRLYGIPIERLPRIAVLDAPTVIPGRYNVGSWEVEPFWAGRKLSCLVE